jgi:hypothetical protein
MTCHCCAQPRAVLYAWTLGLHALLTKRYATHLGHMLLCRGCWDAEDAVRTWPGTPVHCAREEPMP